MERKEGVPLLSVGRPEYGVITNILKSLLAGTCTPTPTPLQPERRLSNVKRLNKLWDTGSRKGLTRSRSRRQIEERFGNHLRR